MRFGKNEIMNISLLVSNFGRAELFKRSLESILPQMGKWDEIVVADDSVEEGEKEKMKAVLASVPVVPYKYVDMKNTKYRSGVFAKNVALRSCSNFLVIINDPEVMHITPNIKIIRERFDSGDRRVFLVPGTMYFSNAGQSLSDFQGMRTTDHSMAPFIGGIPREELMAIGGWDERFVFWGNDDNDLMYRLGLNGVRHVVDDSMQALHQWHERQPQSAMGDYNEPLLYEKPKKIVANEGKEWGLIRTRRRRRTS